MTTEDLKQLAKKVAYWLDQSGADYTHEIVETDGLEFGGPLGVVLNTIDKDHQPEDPDDAYVYWGSRADPGVLFRDSGFVQSGANVCGSHHLGESIVEVNGIFIGSASPKAIAAMLLGQDML